MSIKKKIKNTLHYIYALGAAIRYRFPSNELFVIGVTGTSGKSTTVYLLRQLLEAAGYTVGALSTIDFSIAGENKLNDQKMTMLGRGKNQAYLRKMVAAGCDIAIVETTSEGALQHRHRYINYDTFVFTNLYPEHIEAHGGFDKYKQTKIAILEYAAKQKKKYRFGKFEKVQICQKHECPEKEQIQIPKRVILPINNEHVSDLKKVSFDEYYFFGRNDRPLEMSSTEIKQADESILAKHVQTKKNGIEITFENETCIIPMYGEHNAQNVLAVCAVARSLGISWKEIFTIIINFHNVPGRVEFITEAEALGFSVIVDYAFEPVAMQALYKIVALQEPYRVIHVCSATGGGRDTSRRLPIGKMAGTHADIVIVTDEDPYEEDPIQIIEEVAAGAIVAGKIEDKDLFKIHDRKKAIQQAIALGQEGDIILITGKGSEQGMCVAGGKMIPWDDRTIAREALQKLTQ